MTPEAFLDVNFRFWIVGLLMAITVLLMLILSHKDSPKTSKHKK